MQVLVVLAAALAAAAAAPAPGVGLLASAPLLPKVQYAPAAVSVVRQPHVVQETQLAYRNVPVPVKTVAYTEPQVHLQTDVIQAAPAVATYAAPALTAYAAPVAAPATLAYGAYPHPSAYASPAILGAHSLL